MQTLFISDLHLSPEHPELTTAFKHFLHHKAPHADALYILGDLFDFWIDDKDPTDFAREIKTALREVTLNGTPCYFIHGNRDFLVGKRFSRETGVTLLDEKAVVTLYGRRVLIMHGDTLCLDDVRYLQFREKVHQPWRQSLFRLLPFGLKQKIVSKIQSNTRQDKQNKSLDIMDVSQAEVERVMDEQQVSLLIHGHTHRPDIHSFQSSDSEKIRVVLGDWGKEISVLTYDDQGHYHLDHQLLSEYSGK
ncbi:UDP-2,3-diacylglucosamine diphosphatase [Vibrio quintilis]|uniref:UDP-2,3-diacylglucosamine hydrolase n=1 Tax=Vibrio quintilis TaxID=1117707 RepID=A0A1M7Z1X3_9VIBR|nr:UDP-2,3-diacylglucosamine diphosphatase [Vibrio quintilis]SHO58834.1 UDP-2,3-diacylglucosamine hydrolase [Vibrio quintilis]